MKTTLSKWKQHTVRGLVLQQDRLTAEVEAMLIQRDEIKAIIKALGGEVPKVAKAKRKSKAVHWSKKPGVDPKKVEAWKVTMAKAQKKAKNGA